MNAFVDEFVAQLKKIATYEHHQSGYDWLWGNQAEVKETARLINEKLGLKGQVAIKLQIFANAFRDFTNEDFIATVRDVRGECGTH